MRTTRLTTVAHLLLLATIAIPALALLILAIAALAVVAVNGGHTDVGLGLVLGSPILIIGTIAALEAVSVVRAGAARASHVLVVDVVMITLALVFLALNHGSETGLLMGLVWLVLPVVSLLALARDSRHPPQPLGR